MVLFLLSGFLTVLSSCTSGVRFSTKGTGGPPAEGNFSLILYGCNYGDDPETIAVFDREGDGYIFEPYAPEFNFRVIKGMRAKEAFDRAEKFISCSGSFHSNQLKAIIDNKGDTIGYELRPLYLPLTFGMSDVLDSNYINRENRVVFTIRLKPSVEKMIQDDISEKRH